MKRTRPASEMRVSYYSTLDEDLARAKAILAKGKEELPPDCNLAVTELTMILPTDSYAAYKLLESFVAEIERLRENEKYLTWLEAEQMKTEISEKDAEIDRLRASLQQIQDRIPRTELESWGIDQLRVYHQAADGPEER